MQFNFSFSSFADFFASLKTPDDEIRLTTDGGKVRVQRRGAENFHLRVSNFDNITYHRLSEQDAAKLSEALTTVLERAPNR